MRLGGETQAVILEGFLAPGRRQAAEPLLDQRLQFVGLEVANNHEGEVRSVGEAVLVGGEDLFRGDRRQQLERGWLAARVVVPQNPRHLVLENGGRQIGAIGEVGGHPVFEVLEGLGIQTRRRELQVDELHQGLEILRRGVALEAFAELADGRPGAGHLAGQLLFELGGFEGSEPAASEDLRAPDAGGQVLVGEERRAAGAEGRKEDLVVLEVGALEDHLEAVFELPLGDADFRDVFLEKYTPGGRCFGHQRFFANLVDIRGDFRLFDLGEQRQDLFPGRQRSLGLGRAAGDDHPIVGRDPLAAELVDLFEGDGRGETSGKTGLPLDAGRGFVFEEMPHVFIGQGLGRQFVAFLEGLLEAAQQVDLGPFELGGGEAVAVDPFHFAQERLHALGGFAFPHDRVEAVDHHRPHEGAIVRTRHHEGRIGTLGELGEAGVEEGVVELLDQTAAVVAHRAMGLRRVFEVDAELGDRDFRVLHQADQGFLVAGHGEVRALFAFAARDFAEGGLDFGFDDVRIEVADHHHRHQVGAVPVAVKAHEFFAVGAFDALLGADRQPFGIKRAIKKLRQHLVENPLEGAAAEPPFFDHHTFFLLDLLGVEADAVGPVFEDQKTLVEQGGIVGRHGEHVDGFIKRRVGVEVGAKTHADALQVVDQLVFGQVAGAVEGHVFEEVGEAPLVFVFEHGPGVDGEAQLGAFFRFGVLPDEVGEPVAELALADGRVERQLRFERRGGGVERGRSCRAAIGLRHGSEQQAEQRRKNEGRSDAVLHRDSREKRKGGFTPPARNCSRPLSVFVQFRTRASATRPGFVSLRCVSWRLGASHLSPRPTACKESPWFVFPCFGSCS